jgi:hypothetical protein
VTELEQLFDHMKECSKSAFEEFGHCTPMFVTLEPPLIMPVPFRNLNEKRTLVSLVKAIFKEQKVQRYGFAFEAWFATAKLEPVVDISKVIQPSERPDRQECIYVMAEEKGKPARCGMWKIKRTKKGWGKVVEFMKMDGAEEIGMFRNMLGTEILQ